MINHMIIIIHSVPIGRSVETLLKFFRWNIIIEMLILLKLRNAYNLEIIRGNIKGSNDNLKHIFKRNSRAKKVICRVGLDLLLHSAELQTKSLELFHMIPDQTYTSLSKGLIKYHMK